jgi:AraC-type DNA-binding domain-containing proteins
MNYEMYRLQEDLEINGLITFYYKELTSQLNIEGENHDFWELVYIDKGEIEIYTDTNHYELCQGDIVFYKPNEYHAGRTIKNTAPNLIIISFECISPCMSFFEDKLFRLDEEERLILSKLIKEGTQAFDPPIDSLQMIFFPKKNQRALFGSEQIIKNYLEILLLLLIRKGDTKRNSVRLITTTANNKDSDMICRIIEYMNAHITENLTPEQLCTEFAISRTLLMTMFKSKTSCGVIKYFNKLKISKAKQMIREGWNNFTEISEYLGYSSVHYFSKQFKNETDMTPTEYSRSVRAI